MEITFDEKTHKYFVDGEETPSVTTILGFLTGSHYKAIDQYVLRMAADRGTAVHKTLESLDLGFEPEDIEYEVEPYLKAYLRFLRDYKVEWEGVETIVCGEWCGSRYCGTIDRYGYVNGERSVVDIKTYSQPLFENYLSLCGQTTAYANAIDPNAYWKRYGLFLRKDGTYRLVNCEDYERKYETTGGEIWHKCIELYQDIERWKQNGKLNRYRK